MQLRGCWAERPRSVLVIQAAGLLSNNHGELRGPELNNKGREHS